MLCLYNPNKPPPKVGFIIILILHVRKYNLTKANLHKVTWLEIGREDFNPSL